MSNTTNDKNLNAETPNTKVEGTKIKDNNQRDGLETQEHDLTTAEALSQYLKVDAGTRQGRSIPPLDKWHPTQTADMDLVIKANGEWWHEGALMTRQSLVALFSTVLWAEQNNGEIEYYLKTPVQKLRITVEDVPLLINDVGIVEEVIDGHQVSWLEFTTTTGDIVRLDETHPITLRAYEPKLAPSTDELQVRPYMPVRNGLTALIGRNTFYHLTEIGDLSEQQGETILTLHSGGQSYCLSMPKS